MIYKFLITLIFTSFVCGNDFKVKSSSGIVLGNKVGNVISWVDIPYAIPPIGDLRWKAPRQYNISTKNNLIEPKDNNFCVQEPSGLGGSEGNNYFQELKIVCILILKLQALNILNYCQ